MKHTKRLNRRESKLQPLFIMNQNLLRNNNKVNSNIFHSAEKHSLMDYADEPINKNLPQNAIIGDPVKKFHGHHVIGNNKSPYKL